MLGEAGRLVVFAWCAQCGGFSGFDWLGWPAALHHVGVLVGFGGFCVLVGLAAIA